MIAVAILKGEAAKLDDKLRKAAAAYYAGNPTLSDDQFDALKEELRRLAPDAPFLKEVGAPAQNSLRKVPHAAFMGSLDNAFSSADIAAWVTRCLAADPTIKTAAVGDKYDGLSVSLTYVNGALMRAATRGDGKQGEDVTANARKAKGVPRAIPYTDTPIEVRGEMLILTEDFSRHFAPRGDANARNAAAGTLRRTDGERAEHLTFIAFDAHGIAGEVAPKTESGLAELLATWSFKTAENRTIPFTADAITAAWVEAKDRRGSLPYGVDGLVIKVNSRKRAQALGWSDTCPRGAIACKWRGEMVAETEATGITNSVGHTGAITPVLLVRPVNCGGVTVSNVSLMNWDEVARVSGEHKLGVGSRVRLERSGDVIPRIVAVLSTAAAPFGRPEACPSCSAETFVDGPRQVCRNPTCPAQGFRRILGWLQGRNILHFGENTLDYLMAVGGPVRRVCDLYDLTEAQIAAACGGFIMAKKIRRSLEESKACTPGALFGHIGIPGVGETDGTKIAAALAIASNADVRALTTAVHEHGKVPDELLAKVAAAVGPARAAKFNDGLVRLRNDVARLTNLDGKRLTVAAPAATAAPAGSAWAGRTFAITGATSINRTSLVKIIEAAGGIYKTSVVKGLHYLITEDPDSGSRKNEEAKKKGVLVIGEDQALNMAQYGG